MLKRLYFALVLTLFMLSQIAAQSWQPAMLPSGQEIDCGAEGAMTDPRMANYLELRASAEYDVLVRVINTQGQCARTAFLARGQIVQLRHFPEGVYKLRVAYGTGLERSTSASGNCAYRFSNTAFYIEGAAELDMRLKNKREEHVGGKLRSLYDVPFYEIFLATANEQEFSNFGGKNIATPEF
jgi:hypothetical protein